MDKQEYDKPEPDEERTSRGWVFLFLAVVFVVLMYLIATQGYGR